MKYVYNTGKPAWTGYENYETIEALDYSTDDGVLTFWNEWTDIRQKYTVIRKKKILSLAPGFWCEVMEDELEK